MFGFSRYFSENLDCVASTIRVTAECKYSKHSVSLRGGAKTKLGGGEWENRTKIKSSHDKGGRKGFGLCCVSDNGPSGWINKVTASADDENYQNPPRHPQGPHYSPRIVVIIYYLPYCQITVYII